MKISPKMLETIKKMSPIQLSKWLENFYRVAYTEGLRDGESELDDAGPEEWMEFIRNSPSGREIFNFYYDDELLEVISGVEGVGEILPLFIVNALKEGKSGSS